jgi:hypothetical protein
MGRRGGGSAVACTWRSGAGRARAAGQSGAARGGVGWMWRCTYCLDAGVRAELDGVDRPRRPRDSGSVQQGHPSSREAHVARRRLHVVLGAAADGASACAHAAGHATRDCLDGACRYAARPGHRGTAATVANARRSTGGSSVPAAQQAPTGASGSATRKGGWKRVAGGLHHGVRPESMLASWQAGAEAHGERFGKSREWLTAGPHAEVSEREEKRAADTWDREGTGVHLAVAHRERERASGAGLWCGSGWVRLVKKEIDFEYRKLVSIQRKTENNSKEIARWL